MKIWTANCRRFWGCTGWEGNSGSGEWKTENWDENLGDSWKVEQLLLLVPLLFVLLLPLGRSSHWHGPTCFSLLSASPSPSDDCLADRRLHAWRLTVDTAQETSEGKSQGAAISSGDGSVIIYFIKIIWIYLLVELIREWVFNVYNIEI